MNNVYSHQPLWSESTTTQATRRIVLVEVGGMHYTALASEVLNWGKNQL